MTTSLPRLAIAAAALFALAACGQSEIGSAAGDLAKTATAVAGDAAKAAGQLIDTRTACTLAGQSEAFCGCLQAEMGPRIDQQHIDMMTSVVTASLSGGIDEAVKSATSIDPETRAALTKCAVQGAIGEAVGGQ